MGNQSLSFRPHISTRSETLRVAASFGRPDTALPSHCVGRVPSLRGLGGKMFNALHPDRCVLEEGAWFAVRLP